MLLVSTAYLSKTWPKHAESFRGWVRSMGGPIQLGPLTMSFPSRLDGFVLVTEFFLLILVHRVL